MIELEMHWDSGYYNDESFLPSPLDSRCCNCPYMPDNECGWGYRELGECVFQVEKGKPYWVNVCEDGKLTINDVDIESLVNYLDDLALLHMVKDNWNCSEERSEFRNQHCLNLIAIKRKGKQLAQYYSDYWLWFHSKEPCACCGKVTSEFVVHGNERFGNLIKLCERCSDSEWTSTYMR